MNWDKFKFGPLRDKADEGEGSGDDEVDETEETSEESSDGDESEEDGDEDEEVTEEKEEKDKKKKKKVEASEDEDDLNEEDKRNSTALYKLLKDPKSRNSTLRILAEKEGLLGKGSEKLSEKQTEKKLQSIQEVLEEELGEKYKWIAPNLAKAFERILGQQNEAHQNELNAVKATQIENQTEAALNKLSKETNGQSRKFETRMVKLMDELNPGVGQSVFAYMKNLYTIASSGSNAASIKDKMANKIKAASKDTASRISSTSGGGEGGLKAPKKMLSSRESAQQAYDKIFGQKED